jgi:hypothetical protein
MDTNLHESGREQSLNLTQPGYQLLAHAMAMLTPFGNIVRSGDRAFYVMSFEAPNFLDRTLIKIGTSKDVFDRFKHHQSSWPGWQHRLVIETDISHEIERFWISYLNEHSWKGSPECFMVPTGEVAVICTASVVMAQTSEIPNEAHVKQAEIAMEAYAA